MLMRPLRLVAVAVGVLATVQVLEGSAAAQVNGKCSRATANRLIATLPVADRVLPFYGGLTRAMCVWTSIVITARTWSSACGSR